MEQTKKLKIVTPINLSDANAQMLGMSQAFLLYVQASRCRRIDIFISSLLAAVPPKGLPSGL